MSESDIDPAELAVLVQDGHPRIRYLRDGVDDHAPGWDDTTHETSD